MNIAQEVRIVRWSIIIMLVATPMGFTAIYLVESESDVETTSIMSSFGKITIFDPKQTTSLFLNESVIYQDNYLEFQISKPDDTWEIHAAYDDLLSEELVYLKSKGYLDGIYLEKQHDRRFLITVFDVQKEDFKLDDYVENQILQMTLKEDVKIPLKQISQSNDWAIFAIDKQGVNFESKHGEQMLFLKNNLLYMLQYSGNSPENLTELEKSDFRLILDSFEVLV